ESLSKLRAAGVAALPARSTCETLMATTPSAAALKSRLAFHAPPPHGTVALASPVMTTFRPSSEQEPDTASALWLVALMALPSAAGTLTVTVGAIVSLVNIRVTGAAVLPAASLWLTVTETGP